MVKTVLCATSTVGVERGPMPPIGSSKRFVSAWDQSSFPVEMS